MKCLHLNKKIISKYDSASLYLCHDCQLVFSDKNIKTNQEFSKLYENYYRNEIPVRFNFGVEYLLRLLRLYRALKIFTISPKAKSVLDIGSGRGLTLYYLKKYFKFNTTIGTQLEKNSLEFSRNKLGLDVYSQDLLELNLKDNSLDLITIWHVLEHVKDPEEYLIKIYQLLKKGGKLIIEVPNFNSWTRKWTGKYWLGLDLKYHLTHFTYKSLSKLLTKYNYKIKLVHTFSLEYSTFISTQSIISRLTKSDQLFFSWIQGNVKFKPALILHFILFVILTPLCFFINIILFFSKKGEVLIMVAKK